MYLFTRASKVKPSFLTPFLLVILLVATSCIQAQTYTLHWGSVSWTGPTYSKTITSIGGSGIDASVVITNTSPAGNISSATTATNDAFQNNTPAVGTVGGTAWFLPGTTAGNPLVESVDWNGLSSTVTTVITFTRPVNNISFYVGDMDRTSPLSYVDRFTFTGKYGTAAVPPPVVTKFQATVSGADTVLISGNSAFGNQAFNANAATNSITTQGATVYVQFSNPVTQITLLWDQGPGATGDPARQTVVIGDLSFSKVIPEYPPTANNYLHTPMPQGNAATAIPGLVAADLDGTISSYTVTAIPPAGEGVLSCCGGSAITAGQSLSPAQIATLQFDPAATFAGTSSFSFTATDNDGNVSNTAYYRLPVIAFPPVSNNIMENSMPNTNAATAIIPLSSSDIDGTIVTYQITSLPATGQGVLSVPCPTTFTNAVCTGGFQDLTAAVLGAYPSGIPLTATQMAGMRFDPTAGFVGSAVFNYNAVDNSGNTSNIANYTIPVAATATVSRPPLSDNITSQTLNSNYASTAIPSLQANDLDGTVASFTIVTIPTAAQGVLYCCGGSAVTAGQVLTTAQAATLLFDPAATFTGTASFTYNAKDNANLTGNTATYYLPVVNYAPTAVNINTFVPFNAAATTIPALSGSDRDGTISSYTVITIPTAGQGVLSCCGGTPITAGQSLSTAQAATLKFAPASGYSGNAPFTYSAMDNNSNTSAIANYIITIAPQPPVSNDITNAVLSNALAATVISGLSATDADGTIASYVLLSLPDPSQGVLSITCPNTPSGATCSGGFANLTAAVLAANPNGIPLTTAQAAALRFDPTAGFTGLAAFKYNAIDNSGLTSNNSIYTIPVSGTGNIPPVAKNIIVAAMPNTNAATSITALSATDADGTISNYTLQAIPSVAQGVLTCCGGTAVTVGQVLTTAQAATLQFDPAPTFTGNAEFTYVATDNSGATSAGAIYTIPVTSVPPVANAIFATSMSQSNGPTAIPALSATDADGTIGGYYIESLPLTSQGVLSIPCSPTLTGATCSGGYQDLTAAVLSNYTGTGIPVTATQMAAMRFDPTAGYSGSVVFNYHAVDNSSLISNSTTFTIPVTNLWPLANNVAGAKMLNTNGPTAITSLSGADADGTIASYVINSIPPVAQGVLSIPCAPTPAGASCSGGFADLTAAVLAANPGGISITPAQAAGMRFDPTGGFNGTMSFNYAVYDNNGNISNTAAYTIGIGTSAVLPLNLVALNAARNANNIVVNWKSEQETNLLQYDVEISVNGVDYTKAGSEPARNAASNNYRFTLYNYSGQLYYVRLKMVNANGQFTYSSVVTIRSGMADKNEIIVSPNPASGKVQLRITAATGGNAEIEIVSGVGQVMYHGKHTVYKGQNLVALPDISNSMPSGTYMVRTILDGQVLINKFMFTR